MPDPIKDLYSSLKSTNLFLDEADLREQLNKNPKEVYDVVSKNKGTVGLFLDYDDFSNVTGLKKKELVSASAKGTLTPALFSPSLGKALQGGGIVGESKVQSTLGETRPPKIDVNFAKNYNKKFEEFTGHKELELGSELPQIKKQRESNKYLRNRRIEENEIKPFQASVTSGTLSPSKLEELYAKPYGKKIVTQELEAQMPGSSSLLEKGDPESIKTISFEINAKNRPEAVKRESEYYQSLNNELNNAFANLKARMSWKGSQFGGGGTAAVGLPKTDIENPEQLTKLLEYIGGADYLEDAQGNRVDSNDLIKKINQKLFFLGSQKGIDKEVEALTPKIYQAVTRVRSESEKGEKDYTPEFDEAATEQFKLGLSFLKDTKPAEYQNIIRGIEQRGEIADTDFEDLAKLGQDFYNQQVFTGGATDPSLIGKETDIRYTSRQTKKAEYAKALSEEIASMGYSNKWKIPQEVIYKAAENLGLSNKDIVQDIAANEAAGGYGIVKGGAWRALARGMAMPIKGIQSSVNAVIDSPVDVYLNSKKFDYGDQLIANAKGQYGEELPSEQGNLWYDMVEGFGQFIPQVILAKGIGAGLEKTLLAGRGLTAAQKAATAAYPGTFVSTFAQSYGDGYKDALQKTGSVSKAKLMGTINGLSSAAFELFLPDVKIADYSRGLLKGAKDNLAKNIMKVVDEGGGKEAARSVINQFAKDLVQVGIRTGSNVAKESAEEVGTNLTNWLTEAIFSPATIKDRDLANELLETAKATSISMVIPALIGGAGEFAQNKKITRQGLNYIAINSEEYKPILDKQLADGILSQGDYNLAMSVINSHKQNIKEAPRADANGDLISGERQLEYAFQGTVANINEQKAEATNDPVQKKFYQDKAKRANEIKEKILYGEDVVEGMPKQDIAETIDVEEEPDQEIVLKIEEEPEVPATEEKTYRVEYFDPETRKMTHQMFATEAEGEAFKNTLTREQTSQGVTSYFEKAPAKGVGEEVAAPQVPAAQKEIFVTGTAQGLENLKGKAPEGFKDRRMTYEQSGGKQIYFTEDIVGDKKIFSIVDRGATDDYGREGFVSTSMSVPKESTVTLEDVKGELEKLHQQTQTAVDKNTGKIDKAKLGSLELGVGEEVEAAPQVPAAPIVEDKKADIERRRQDELSKYPNLYKNAKTKEELQKVVKDWLDLDIFSQQDSTPNVRSALYTPGGFERGKELFLEERKQNIDDFNNRLNAKYDAELASLGVGEVAPEAAPQVPAAPEKTQDEVAKEQTRETDLLLGGQAEQRRKGGKYTKDGVEYVRNPKGQGLTSEVSGEVRFTNDVSLPFKYKLVEAETLQPSHQDGIRNPLHFIPEAQPKNRNDVGSLQAEESFANNPRFSELGENTNAYSGAPVVNERGEVVQGNNRSAGLRKGYQRNNPQYKNDLAANAEQFGFTREQVEGMKNPVLVREIAVSDQGAIELGNYDAKDLETGGKRRVDPIAVTRRMPFDVKGRIADLFTGEETLNQAIRANQKRLLELLNPYLNQAQRNTITKEGVLTDAGIKDLEAVVQQFLFDNGDTALPDLFENLSATQKEGLRKSLPYIFSVSPEKSLVPDIQEAILAVNDFNTSGTGEFDAWLLQGDIFNDGKTPKDKYTPLELAIAKTIVESNTQKEIAKKFADYADVVKDKEADMFEAARPGKSRKEGVLEIFKTEDYAKPISERGRKEVTPKEKPTPKPSAEKRAGDAARSLAEKIRAGKINKEGFRASTGFDVVWDAALEIVASSLEAGASVADAVQDGLKYIRTTDWYKNLTDKKGFEDKFTNRLNEEYNAIQVGGPKEVPVGEAPRGRGKVESGVPPTKPPKAPKEGEAEGKKVVPPIPPTPPKTEEEGEYTPRGRDKALINKLYTAANIPEEARAGFEKEGLRYQTKSQKEAELVAKGVIDAIGIDEALRLAESFEFDGDVNSLIYAESLNRLAEMERNAKTPEEKQALAKKFAEVGIQYGIKSQYGGRFNAAINYFYQKSPLGIVLMEDAKRKEEFNNFSKGNEQSWKEAYEIIKTELDALKEEMQGKKAKAAFKTAEARAEAARKRREALKEKYKKGKGGGLTLTTGGLTKEGIEYVGELVVTYIQEGVANVEVIIQKVFFDLRDVIGKPLDESTAKEVEKEVRRTFKENKSKTLDRIRKRLSKLSKKKQDEVVRRSFNQIIELGGLDFDDFKNIIADVTGYGQLTDQEKARFEELVRKTNVVERMAEKARDERTEQSLRDFRKSEMEAGKAARELNQLVWNKPDILKRLTSIMQLSTLGIPALINNPIYNIWNQATLRFPVGLINDLVDRGITLSAQATGTEYQREYNSLETQVEFFKKLGFGTKESIEQLFTGLSRQDYIQKEVGGQQIQPLQAAKDWWASFTGKKKLTTAQVWDKAIQATVGIPAEAIARALNIGDKPQRFAAEGSQAAAFAKAFGLKGLDYKLFIEFPREEAYRKYKLEGLSDSEAARKADYVRDVIVKEGERATFQQENLVNTALSAVFNTVFGSGKETGLANLVKATTVSPYIKIPTNAFWSYYNLVNPEIALLQSFVHGGRAYNLNKKGEKEGAKLALRESRYWLAHAITGMAMKAVVIALVKAGVYNPGSDEEESKREREGKAFYEGQGTVNIDKLTAMLNGKDPTQVKDGLLIANRWFGQWGTVGNAIAKKYENMTPEQRKNESDYYDFMLGELSTDVLQEMEQGVFANTSALLSALNSGSWNRYFANTLNMFTNIVHPAAIAQISRAELPNYTTQKADSFLKELQNAMLTRSSLLRELTGKYPPSKVSIWGEPILKQGGTIQKLFNITRANKDMFARPLYDDAKKYGDPNFFPPAITSSLNGKQLTVDQTRTLQEFVGQARKERIAPYINDSAKIEGFNVKYSDLKDPEDKKKVLNYLYEVGREDGLEKFYNVYKDLKPKEKSEDFLKELQFDLFKTLQKYK